MCYSRNCAPASHTAKDSPTKSPVASMGKCANMCLLYILCGHFSHSGLPSFSNRAREMGMLGFGLNG